MNNSIYSNNSAYMQAIDTLTEISAKVLQQKFYTIKNIPDFVDIEEGRGGVAEEIMNWSVFDAVGNFEDGNFGSNVDFERTASADIILNKKMFYRQKWKKSITYNQMDIIQADRAKVVNIIEGKETARKRNFDLGLQKTIFLGSDENENITGLLNNKEVNVNATLITKFLSSMTAQEFNSIIAQLPNIFFANTNNTVMYNRLVMPTADYNGLASQMSEQFPIKTKLEVLEEALKTIAAGYGINDFKILPCAYANKGQNGQNLNIYALYNKNADTLVYDLPLNYRTTAFNTLNNFDFTNIAYAMYGSVNLLRPQEMLYFTF